MVYLIIMEESEFEEMEVKVEPDALVSFYDDERFSVPLFALSGEHDDKENYILPDKSDDDKENYIIPDKSEVHAGEEQWTQDCEKCNKTFNSRSSWLLHLSYHKPSVGRLTCNICSQVFSSMTKLLKHSKEHPVINHHECMSCHMKFSDNAAFADHVCYSCKHCSMVYRRQHNLQQHMSQSHPRNTNSITCETCGEVFMFKLELRQHMKKHVKRFECDICNVMFSSLDVLSDHIAQHMDDQLHECSHCGEVYLDEKLLVQHIATHSEAS